MPCPSIGQILFMIDINVLRRIKTFWTWLEEIQISRETSFWSDPKLFGPDQIVFKIVEHKGSQFLMKIW